MIPPLAIGRARKSERVKIPKALSVGEETFALHMKARGLDPLREQKFHPERDWRLDFLFPYALPHGMHLAVEIDGGAYSRGRHTRGKGFEEDCIKLNAAATLGIVVLRYTTRMVTNGTADLQVAQLMGAA